MIQEKDVYVDREYEKIVNEIDEFIGSRLNINKWRTKEGVEKRLETMISKKKILRYGKCKRSDGTMGKTYKDIVDVIKGYRMKNDLVSRYSITHIFFQ